MSELTSSAIAPKAIQLPAAAWGPGVDGRTGERLFTWRVDGHTVSQRYRATRQVVLTYTAGARQPALADGVGGLLTKRPDRRQGFGSDLMTASMHDSRREGYSLGMLFCGPALELWYRHLGWWLTRDLSVIYCTHRGAQVSLSAPNLWIGLLALSPQPSLSTIARIEIDGPLW